MEVGFAVAVLAVLAVLAAVAVAAAAFRGKARGLAARAAEAGPALAWRADLPAPVRDFARRAGAGQGPIPAAAEFRQKARLRPARGGAFGDYLAHQVVAIGRPDFVWEARRMAGPVTAVRVIDAFVGGKGLLEARLLGAIPVARAEGAEATLGEALRYLAELPWAPDAILANAAIRWSVGTDGTAEAVLPTGGGEARVRFGFDAAGDIVTAQARRPAREPDGTVVTRDWIGHFSDYAEIGPRRIPRRGAVGWVYPEGTEVYFEGEILGYQLWS